MKKEVCILFCGLMLAGCGSKTATIKVGEATYTNDKKEVTTAKVKTKDGKLSEVELDETANNKYQTKKELGNDYDMKQASKIGKEWYEQIRFLENYLVKNGMDNIKLNSEGKAENDDVKTGCTIRIDGFLKAVRDAEKNAK